VRALLYKSGVRDRGFDVVVVGGGAVGCAVALGLRQRGLSVAIVERARPCGEASSAAAGILAPQVEADHEGPLFELLLASRGRYPGFAAEVAALARMDVGYRRSGALVLAHDADGEAALGRRAEWQHARGLAARLIGPSEAAALEPALAPCRVALHLPDEAQVDAQALARALPLAARSAGAHFVRAEVRGILRAGGAAHGIETDGGPMAAGAVVVAAGAWSAALAGSGLAPGAVRPVRGQMLVLDGPGLLTHVVFGDGGYLVPRADGRVLVGSTNEEVGFDKSTTAAGLARLRERAARLCAPLAAARTLGSWAGLRPGAAAEEPLVGPGDVAGLYLATGHYRNGILLAPVTGDRVADLIAGTRLANQPSVRTRPDVGVRT
jgi:glycine oxidase